MTGSNQTSRVPIDLDTFLAIDSAQMNQNLACLTPTPEIQNSFGLQEFVRKMKKGLRSLLNQAWNLPPVKMLGAALLLVVAVEFLLASTGEHDSWHNVLLSPMGEPVYDSHTLAKSVTGSRSDIAVTPTGSLRPEGQAISDASSNVDQSTSLNAVLPESMLLPNKSDKFTIQVLGDCHVIMRPPRWFHVMKKAPTLFFKVKRQEKTVQYTFLTLFDNVYALQIPQDDRAWHRDHLSLDD